MSFVYRYIKQNKIVYVGITDNLPKRIKEHQKDHLAQFDGSIEYFFTETRQDADLIETYLINKWKPISNTAKKNKGDVSFLGDGNGLPWVKYEPNEPVNLIPFNTSSWVKTVKVETVKYQSINKPVYKITPEVIDQQIQDSLHFFEDEIKYERGILKEYRLWKSKVPTENLFFFNDGRLLHLKKLKILRRAREKYFCFEDENYQIEMAKIYIEAEKINDLINKHNEILRRCKDATNNKRKKN